ncbi:hypothetical protein J4Q44_G00123520 [Coregonus suidteri]|uniref:Uncharacterized protein n=1 Tax=Coregonus suidteri TaxID=861788 RepID=A0AAN8LX35_9TELE
MRATLKHGLSATVLQSDDCEWCPLHGVPAPAVILQSGHHLRGWGSGDPIHCLLQPCSDITSSPTRISWPSTQCFLGCILCPRICSDTPSIHPPAILRCAVKKHNGRWTLPRQKHHHPGCGQPQR